MSRLSFETRRLHLGVFVTISISAIFCFKHMPQRIALNSGLIKSHQVILASSGEAIFNFGPEKPMVYSTVGISNAISSTGGVKESSVYFQGFQNDPN